MHESIKRWKRKMTDGGLLALIYGSAFFTVAILLIIIGFILYKGLPGINIDFLTRQWDSKTTFVNVEKIKTDNKEESSNKETKEVYIESLLITLVQNEEGKICIKNIKKNSPVNKAVNMKNDKYKLKVKDEIGKVGTTNLKDKNIIDAVDAIENSEDTVRLKVTRPGGGIVPMLVSTLYIIVLSLLVSAPIGILSSVYLNEYAKPGKTLNIIRFAIQNLAGIPSIIYGLFGMIVFVQMFKMQYSILAGSLTLSIILLPTIISTTEEALKAIPRTYRESSLGLGATKLQTTYKIVLPNALPGILVAVILSIGRIVGESAALIWTAGTIAQIPGALTGSSAGAATLTTKLYWLIKEKADLQSACSIAIVILTMIIMLNWISKIITKKFMSKQGN